MYYATQPPLNFLRMADKPKQKILLESLHTVHD